MPVIPAEQIASRIYLLRNQKVMLDSDLAELYGVPTSALNQQVRRNLDRFPEDFAFQLNPDEFENLMSQIVISSGRHGGRRKPPYAFTEQGVAMLSSVLRSQRAAQINISIVRAFVRLRELLASDRELARKVEEHDRKITVLFETVQRVLVLPAPTKKRIGFATPLRDNPKDERGTR
jgi:hypothetical protein